MAPAHAALRPIIILLLLLRMIPAAPAADAFTSVLAKADLDAAVFAEWMDGAEKPIGSDRRREGPSWLVWTRDSQAGWYGQEFGDSTTPGARHLRLGFARAVPVGTILAAAENISVLRPGSPYPGDLADDAQWLPAQRLGRDGLTGSAEAGECATWVLPPGTTTRAVRVTHVAKQNDRRYNGLVGALWLLAGRYDNIAPQASATASANAEAAGKVIDGRDNGTSGSWDNGEQGQEFPISPAHPAWVMLAWAQPRTLSGIGALGAGAAMAEVQICTAPADQHPSLADESAWTTIVPATAIDPLYPRSLPLCTLPFPAPVTTRGVRLRFVKPFDDEHCHPHLGGSTRHGRRVWLAELMAFAPSPTSR